MSKITALSVPFPGVSAVLENGSKLGMWDFVRLGGERVSIPRSNVTLLGAWHPQYEPLLNLGGKLGVVWTSCVAEMEFTPIEWQYLERLLKDPRISFIWFGQRELAELFPEKSFYAPYPLSVLEPLPVPKQPTMTLFCAGGPKKNISNMLAAVALVQRGCPETLNTNIEAARPLLDFLGVRYAMHPWLPSTKYHRILAGSRVNLACSFAETLNYQVAEALGLGTISVTSETIPLPSVCVSNCNSPSLIADAIRTAMNLTEDQISQARTALVQQASDSNQELTRALQNI